MTALKKILSKFSRSQKNQKEFGVSLQKSVLEGGELTPAKLQKEVIRQRDLSLLAMARADRVRWFYICIFLSIALIITMYGWYQANERFASNIQVAWVKLDPSGGYTVQFQNERTPTEFYQATIDTKLQEFIELRYAKKRATIATNYLEMVALLSATLRQDFIKNYQPLKVATEFVACTVCEEVTIKVNYINHFGQRPAYNAVGQGRKNIYSTWIFFTETSVSADGTVTAQTNRVAALKWTFRPKNEILNQKNWLQVNPLGMEIVELSLRNDPTPPGVSRDEPPIIKKL